MYRNVGRTIPVKIRAAIVGANGYTGFELIKLLYNHPHFTLTAAASRSFAGTRLRDVYPALSFVCGNDVFVPPDADEIAKKADVVFTALPHAASAASTKTAEATDAINFENLPIFICHFPPNPMLCAKDDNIIQQYHQ